MKPIIIGAGRGQRLNSMTDNQPKCYARIGDLSILDWTLEAFTGAGLAKPVFIGGYKIDQIKNDYPQFTYCNNTDWENNNILVSLMHAVEHMNEGFICAYSDILFRDTVVERAMNHPGNIVLCVDTHWRDRYRYRLHHPEEDAEKVTAEGDIVTSIHRDLDPDDASGEYIGVAKFSPSGSAQLIESFYRLQKKFKGRPWREAAVFEKAYLIHLFQDMIENGITFHHVTTEGDYMEIDTEEDYAHANRVWPERNNKKMTGRNIDGSDLSGL